VHSGIPNGHVLDLRFCNSIGLPPIWCFPLPVEALVAIVILLLECSLSFGLQRHHEPVMKATRRRSISRRVTSFVKVTKITSFNVVLHQPGLESGARIRDPPRGKGAQSIA
jgi:hypothetical protein